MSEQLPSNQRNVTMLDAPEWYGPQEASAWAAGYADAAAEVERLCLEVALLGGALRAVVDEDGTPKSIDYARSVLKRLASVAPPVQSDAPSISNGQKAALDNGHAPNGTAQRK